MGQYYVPYAYGPIYTYGAEHIYIFMDKKPNEILNQQYSINSYTTINIPYNWPAFLAASCLNIGYTSSYELIRIRN